MTHHKVQQKLFEEWQEGFADAMAQWVIDHEALSLLFDLAIAPQDYSRTSTQSQQTGFRSAYVIERIYFGHYPLFEPFTPLFIDHFAQAANGSIRRHWCKIAADLLAHCQLELTNEQAEEIAQACAEWVIDPRERIAVKVWALEILFQLQKQLDWISEVMPDLIIAFCAENSPASLSRCRRWREEGKLDHLTK